MISTDNEKKNIVLSYVTKKAFNLSKSLLEYTLTHVASTTGAANWMAADSVNIQNISLYTRGGLFLCSLENALNYVKTVIKYETNFQTI
jgi:hypothetical protein